MWSAGLYLKGVNMGLAYIEGAGGGGVRSSDVTASAADILSGKYDLTAQSDDEVVQGTMPNNGTVNHSLPINGSFTIAKGYHSGSGKVTQSITTKGAATYYATTSDQTISAGRYLSGNQVIKKLTQTNLTGANIKPGVTISVNNGNANVWSVAGTMASKAAATYYPSTSDQTIAAGQYLSGVQTIKAISQQNLTAANIKKGVTVYVKNGSGNIYAVTGTWEGYVPTTSIPYNRGVWASGYAINGCAKPSGSSFYTTNPIYSIQYLSTSFRTVDSEDLYHAFFYYFNPKVLNNVNTINISYIGNWTFKGGSGFCLGVYGTQPPNGITTDQGGDGKQFNIASCAVYARNTNISASTENTVSINVSSISTSMYIIFGAEYNDGGYGKYIDITKIWYT